MIRLWILCDGIEHTFHVPCSYVYLCTDDLQVTLMFFRVRFGVPLSEALKGDTIPVPLVVGITPLYDNSRNISEDMQLWVLSHQENHTQQS